MVVSQVMPVLLVVRALAVLKAFPVLPVLTVLTEEKETKEIKVRPELCESAAADSLSSSGQHSCKPGGIGIVHALGAIHVVMFSFAHRGEGHRLTVFLTRAAL